MIDRTWKYPAGQRIGVPAVAPMIVKKLAIRPVSPIRASTAAAVPSPKTAWKPSNNGVAGCRW